MYTPQRNLAFSCINCSSTASPSGLIAVRLLRSTTSSRPTRPVLAFSYALVSSAAQGAMSLPSTMQSALALALDNRDLQHAAPIPRYENATHAPKRFGSNYCIFNVRMT